MDKIVIGVIENNKKILMVRRRIKEGDLSWQFPGGVVGENETEESAIVREVFEEVDVVCRVQKKLGERIHPLTGKNVGYWLCDYLSGEVFVKYDDELDKAEWMSVDELLKAVTSDIFSVIKEYLRQFREDNI